MRAWVAAGIVTGILLGAGSAALIFLPDADLGRTSNDPALLLVEAEEAELDGEASEARGRYERLISRHPGSPEAAIARRALRRLE